MAIVKQANWEVTTSVNTRTITRTPASVILALKKSREVRLGKVQINCRSESPISLLSTFRVRRWEHLDNAEMLALLMQQLERFRVDNLGRPTANNIIPLGRTHIVRLRFQAQTKPCGRNWILILLHICYQNLLTLNQPNWSSQGYNPALPNRYIYQ